MTASNLAAHGPVRPNDPLAYRVKNRTPPGQPNRPPTLRWRMRSATKPKPPTGGAMPWKSAEQLEAWAQWCEPKAANVLPFPKPTAIAQ